MFRRVVAILVLVGIAASQAATLPHTHTAALANDSHDHNGRPHFHFDFLGHGHAHEPHGHPHGDGRGHRHEPATRPPAGGPLAENGGGAPAHNDSAVYFLAGPLLPASSGGPMVGPPELSAIARMPISDALLPDPSWAAGGAWHPPDRCCSPGKLFLKLRVLLL
jgi:hypothetical protein